MTSRHALDGATVAASIVLVLGLALMAFMVIVESEPGLLPLLLVVSGGIGLALARRRARRRQVAASTSAFTVRRRAIRASHASEDPDAGPMSKRTTGKPHPGVGKAGGDPASHRRPP